jgi:hypothetical protein
MCFTVVLQLNERTRLFFPPDDDADSHALQADGPHRAGKQRVTPSKMRQLEFHKHRDHFHTHVSTAGYSSASATIFWAALFAHSIMEGIGEPPSEQGCAKGRLCFDGCSRCPCIVLFVLGMFSGNFQGLE